MKITNEMLDKGQHVLSEWLNDNAPIGERRYRDPAKACFEAMLALAAPASAVKVKPLEWEIVDGGNAHRGKAGTFEHFVKLGWRLDAPYEYGFDCYATIDEAKAAAQADYESRIRSAILTVDT